MIGSSRSLKPEACSRLRSHVRPPNGPPGFTLTQLLLALAALLFASLVVPAWLAVRVNESRIARAERDAHAIAEAIERFERDFGFPPAWRRADDRASGREADGLDLLVGPGEVPKLGPAAAGWASGRADTLANQLIDNGPGYGGPGGGAEAAWRGPYVATAPRADPWQNRYIVNVGVAPARQGARRAGSSALVVVSAGPNGIVETPYWESPEDVRAGGDDIVVHVRRAGPM